MWELRQQCPHRHLQAVGLAQGAGLMQRRQNLAAGLGYDAKLVIGDSLE